MVSNGYWVFCGEDGSLGYMRGAVYQLTITWDDKNAPTIQWPHVCPYSSKFTFEQNWRPVTELKEVRSGA